MPFKCRLLARDKTKAKALVDRYDGLPASVITMLHGFIDALDDDAVLADGVVRVIEVYAEGSFEESSGIRANVSYRLVL